MDYVRVRGSSDRNGKGNEVGRRVKKEKGMDREEGDEDRRWEKGERSA